MSDPNSCALQVFAAFETDVRRERQLEGIAMAKRQGAYKGGKACLDRERVKELLDTGLGPAAIARTDSEVASPTCMPSQLPVS